MISLSVVCVCVCVSNIKELGVHCTIIDYLTEHAFSSIGIPPKIARNNALSLLNARFLSEASSC